MNPIQSYHAARQNQIKDLHDLLLRTCFDLIRFLKSYFNSLYTDWEMDVHLTHALSSPPQGKRDHNMPFQTKQRVEAIDEDLIISSPNYAIELLESATKDLILDNEDVFQLQVNDLKKEMGNNLDLSKLQELHTTKQLKGLEAKLYELPVEAIKDKIRRYREYGSKLANKYEEVKTLEEILREDAGELEKLILEMMRVARQKDDLSGNSSQNPQTAAKYREQVEARLKGAQPWKRTRDQNDQVVSKFLTWIRKSRRKDSPEAMKEFLALLKEKEKNSASGSTNQFSQHEGQRGSGITSQSLQHVMQPGYAGNTGAMHQPEQSGTNGQLGQYAIPMSPAYAEGSNPFSQSLHYSRDIGYHASSWNSIAAGQYGTQMRSSAGELGNQSSYGEIQNPNTGGPGLLNQSPQYETTAGYTGNPGALSQALQHGMQAGYSGVPRSTNQHPQGVTRMADTGSVNQLLQQGSTTAHTGGLVARDESLKRERGEGYEDSKAMEIELESRKRLRFV